MEGNGYETRQSSLLQVLFAIFGVESAQNHSETDKDEHTFCTFTENSYYKNKSRKTRCFTNHV